MPSVKSCLACQTSYCELHLMPHLRDLELLRHGLMDPAAYATSHLCRTHKNPLTMFCEKDQKPVCERCTERNHKNHRVVPIGKKSKKVKVRSSSTYFDLKPIKLLHFCTFSSTLYSKLFLF